MGHSDVNNAQIIISNYALFSSRAAQLSGWQSLSAALQCAGFHIFLLIDCLITLGLELPSPAQPARCAQPASIGIYGFLY